MKTKKKKPEPRQFPFTDEGVAYVATVTPLGPDENVVSVEREDDAPITDEELLESLETYALENVVVFPNVEDWPE